MIFYKKNTNFLASLLLFFCLISGIPAEEFGVVSVELLPPLVSTPVLGAGKVSSFRITNNGYKPAEVVLRGEAEGGVVSRSFLIPARSAITSDLALPGLILEYGYGISGGTQSELYVTVDGKSYRSKKTFDSGIFSKSSVPAEEVTLGAIELSEDAIKFLSGENNYKNVFVKAELAAEQWPADLRIYMDCRYIWLNSEFLPPPETVKILRDWVGLGGTLIVDVKPGKMWPDNVPGATEGFYAESIGIGKMYTARIFKPGMQRAFEKMLEAQVRGNGYLSSNTQTINLNNIDEFKKKADGMLEKSGVKLFECLARERFPIDGTIHQFENASEEELRSDVLALPKIPAALVVGLLIVFVLLIGPVNYFYFRKRHQELMVLVSTPIVSFICCGAVILLISINEGWYTRGVSNGVTLLDQLTNQAYTSSETVLYSPGWLNVAPTWREGEILRFCRIRKFNGELHLGNGQFFEKSLLQPRIPLVIESKRAESRKEQLKITENKSADGKLDFEVVNGFGKEIKSLVIAGRNGIVNYQKCIAPGERVKIPGKNFDPDDTNELFSPRIMALRLSNGEEIKPWNIPQGYYVATLDDIIFYSTGIIPEKFTTTQHVIGKFEDIKNAD